MKTKLIIVLFVITSFAKAQYTNLLNFDYTTNGGLPLGALISDGTFLYGMSQKGGVNDFGTIFKIKPDGTGYEKLLDFDGATNGREPFGSLISDGTFLYGMASYGGANNFGTIFKIMPDGTGFVKLLDFNGTTNGKFPSNSLIYDGTFLYGMTYSGGINNLGTIFKILPDGTGYIKLLDFDGSSLGRSPTGSLIYDGTFLYGTTRSGGVNDFGTIFKITPNGTGFVKLLDFDGSMNGSTPWGDLISDGTFLYGMTQTGGVNNLGTIFKIQPNGTGYVTLLGFDGSSNGSKPTGSLILDGTFIYGMTRQGGTNDYGTIFKIQPNGTGYVKLLDFANATNGGGPQGSLLLDGTFLYGMTEIGGANEVGTIFKYQNCSPVTFSQSLSVCAGQSVTVGTNTYTATGTYTDVLTTINGCDSTVTTNLVVNTLPTITVNSGSICEGNSFTMTPSGASTYTVSSGATVVTPTTNTSYTVTGTDVNGCINYAVTTVTVNSNPTILVSTNNSLICVGETASLTASGATSYTWNTTETTTGIDVSPTTTTNYTVNGTDVNGCMNSAMVTQSVSTCTGIQSVSSHQPLDIRVYPNPSNGIYTIELPFTCSISVIDMIGKVVYIKQISESKQIINLSDLSNGLYTLKVENDNFIKTVRVIKE